jgi:signal transduction histidine kinase
VRTHLKRQPHGPVPPMSPFSRGAAFVDRSGVVVAADVGFETLIGLGDDPTAGLRARAESSPELRALLRGEGPSSARVPGAAGEVELERIASRDGVLLLVRTPGSAEWLEQAMRSQALTRLASGLAHDVKNPLNAMALQIALLGEKLSSRGEIGVASDTHLAAIRDQIGRVNEVVRRFLDVADPTAPLGYTDLGALLADAGHLFAHDARRRRIELALDAPVGTVRTCADASRVGRLLLGLLHRALAETPESGRIHARAAADGGDATLTIEHGAGDRDAELGYYTDVVAEAARSLDGRLAIFREGGVERVVLRLPRYEP